MRELSTTRAGINYLRERSHRKSVVAVTGGCLGLPEHYAEKLSLVTSLLAGFAGAVIIGSGQVRNRRGLAVPTIMEIGPELCCLSKETTVLGLSPESFGETLFGFSTVKHPNAPPTLTFEGTGWGNEALERLVLLNALRKSGWQTSLVVFNGGPLSLNEGELATRFGHRVLAFSESGGAAALLANARLSSHPVLRSEVNHDELVSCGT